MSEDNGKKTFPSEVRIKGMLDENGVKISEKQGLDELSSRGYGTTGEDGLFLRFYEAMYLMEKGLVEVENDKGETVDFEELLRHYEVVDENAWTLYLTYRDLRSRGYVVRGGFGWGVDFRVYKRGEYGKDTAKYLVLSMQEGKPTSPEILNRVLKHSRSLKKDLILAVMNRRGEIVYYSISQLTLK